MLPKLNRLTRLEVETIKRSRLNPVSGQYFGLVKLFKEGEPKFAVIVSNKLSKSAVIRNRIRRSVYRTVYPILNQQKGWHLFLAKKISIDASEDHIKNDVEKLLV